MNRRTVAVDRLGCAVAGGALTAGGLAAAAWPHGDLHVPADASVRLPWLPAVATAGWWPAALVAVGVVLVAAGVLLVLGHRPGRGLGAAALPGPANAGALTVDLDSAAAAAATRLTRQPHVAAASGTAFTDRGQRVIQLDVTIDATGGGLAAATGALDVARRDLAAALDGVPVAVRFLVRTPRHRPRAGRVA